MARAAVAVHPGVGIGASALVRAWEVDPEARALGPATVERLPNGSFLPGVVEWVVIPLAVNVASSVLYDLVKRLTSRARTMAEPTLPEVVLIIEGVERMDAAIDHLIVVRTERQDPG